MIKPGLRRLILVNAHIKGRAVEVRLDGHANLSGENAIGKTSLLKLIPFFYGSLPNRLCPPVDGNKNFVDYYLPSDKSYLVYEYATEHGLNCVAVYRHTSGQKPAYRFLPGPFRQEVFYTVEEDGRCRAFSSDKLKQRCVIHDVAGSRQVETVLEYRAILMNQKAVIDRSEDAKELRQLVASYSLSPRRPIYHLEKVVEEALGSSGSVERVKAIIANILEEDGVEVVPFASNVPRSGGEVSPGSDEEAEDDGLGEIALLHG